MPDDDLPADFRAAVEAELSAIGFTPAEWNGPQLNYRVAGDDAVRQLGAGNLLKRVKLNDPSEMVAIVREFVTNVTTVSTPNWKMPETLEECADRLLPRIGPPFDSIPDGKGPWSKAVPGTNDLCVNLVVDFPTTMAYVSKDMMRKSVTSSGDWLDRALANLRAQTPADWLAPLGGDSGVLCCHTTDSYDAARALLLCELTGNDPAGWLVAVPARDWLFVRKVEVSGLAHFHSVKLIATRAKAEQPYPISDTVYWLRPGKRWLEFPIEVADGKVTLSPPPEFIEVLNALSAGGGEAAE